MTDSEFLSSTMRHADDPLSGKADDELRKTQEVTLGNFLLALAIASPLVALGLYLREGFSAIVVAAISLSLVAWLCRWWFRHGHTRLAAHLIVFTILLVSVGGVLADGSVRSASVLVMIAGVVAAGTFLPRRSMYVAGVFALLSIAVLNVAENLGLLRAAHLQRGWVLWFTQSAVLVTIMVGLLMGRYRMYVAYLRQQQALQRAQAVEAELRASEARVTVLLRNNPVACVVQSIDRGVIVDCNQAFCTLSGYTRDELINASLPTLWADPNDHLAFRARVESIGRVQGMMAKGQRRDGSLFDAQVHAEVVEHGEDRLLITMVLDASAEMASRIELEKSRERFSKAFNFSPLGMTITRLSDGLFIEVNPANERVLGYTQGDFAGKTTMEAGVWLSEADRQRYVQTLQRHGRLVGYETRMRSKVGEVVDVRIWAEIIDIDGEPCALSFTLNVAAEKQREAMLLTVAEGVSGETGEAFFRSLAEQLAKVIGADGVVVGELDSYRRLNTLSLLWGGEQQPNHNCDISFTLCDQALTQTDMLLFENPAPGPMLLKPPFSDKPLSAFVGQPRRHAAGSPGGLLSAVWRERPQLQPDFQALLTIFASRCNAELLRLRRDREILQLQATLEQRVQERTEQLEYLNRELDAFAYSVSHDLKSPLRAIDGFMHLLQEQMQGRLQPEDQDLVDRVLASATRMNRLITDLLALARVSQGQLQRSLVDVSDLAEGVLRQERHRDPTREIEVVIAPGLKANCDPRLAQVVLENLLGNAWKYTRHQPHPRIEFGQTPTAPDEPPVFYIRDNGAGFDMARVDRLFKPFTRLHTPQEFEGTGIGLATVRRIIERHGGQIHATAAVGQGATFWFGFGRPSVES